MWVLPPLVYQADAKVGVLLFCRLPKSANQGINIHHKLKELWHICQKKATRISWQNYIALRQ